MNNNSYVVDGILFHTGDKIACNIEHNEIIDAKLYIEEDSRAFICQNIISGAEAPDLLGYEYSWVFDLKDTADRILISSGISEFRKVKIKCFDGIIDATYPRGK
jgi:hypothetical protein